MLYSDIHPGTYYSYAAEDILTTFGGLIAGIAVFLFIRFILCIVANYVIYKKAGQPGWAAIIPFYSSFIEHRILFGNGWSFLVPATLSIISLFSDASRIFEILLGIWTVFLCWKKSKAFGQNIGFAVGLVFFKCIFSLILAFGQYQYKGVPLDGFSWWELKNKFNSFANNNADAQYRQPDNYQANENQDENTKQDWNGGLNA